jgi:hypothetical protein
MKMIKDLLTIVCLQLCVAFGSFSPSALAMTSPAVGLQTFRTRQPNLYAPHVYADKIDFLATLENLPGAQRKQSYWELSYQLYFLPEARYYEALGRFPQGGYSPTPEEFPGKILLAASRQKKTRLSTLQERTIMVTGVDFKPKVPDAQRTMFGVLVTVWAVKIFDAELKTTIYESGMFLTDASEVDPRGQKQAVARKTLYLNFSVTPKGTLNYSQLRPRTIAASR